AAGDRAKQVHVLLGRDLRVHLLRRRRDGDDFARGDGYDAGVAASRPTGCLDNAGDEPRAARIRNRVVYQLLRREGAAGQQPGSDSRDRTSWSDPGTDLSGAQLVEALYHHVDVARV